MLLGAGASHDSVSSEPRGDPRVWRPPLVTDLFSERFEQVLLRYPMVHNAAPEIRHATTLRQPAQIGLEDYLRSSFRDSDDHDDKRTYAAVPLYLQELLVEVGRHWTTAPDSYQLLDSLLRRNFREIVYVTLNYDTLLDGVLARRHPLRTFDDYIRDDARWSLIKPHGSTTWRRRILNASASSGWSFADPLPIIEEADDLDHVWSDDLATLRQRHDSKGDLVFCYPALSVPLGPGEKTLNCPEIHLEWLRDHLSKSGAINLLTIGYSGADTDVLELIAEAGSEIKTALVVCGDQVTAHQAFDRVAGRLGFGMDVSHQIGAMGFAATMTSSEFSAWIEQVGDGGSARLFFDATLDAMRVERLDAYDSDI